MATMETNHVKLSEQVRQAVKESGLSRYAICKASGIDQGQFSRFMAGTKGLSIGALDNLGDVLGLNIVTTGKRPEIPRRKPRRPRKER